MQELTEDMIACASLFIDTIKPSEVDLSLFKEYKSHLPYKQRIDQYNAPDVINKCLYLKNKSNEYASVCHAMKLEAKRMMEKFWSQALLYDIRNDEKIKDMTVTADVRKAYANMAPEVQRFEDLRNAWESLADYFTRLHDDMTDNYYYYKRVFEQRLSPEE